MSRADTSITMNRAQRWVLAFAVLMALALAGSRYLLPPEPTPTTSSAVQWDDRIFLAPALMAWWGGLRQFRRRRLSPERLRLVLGCWHATFVLVAIPFLVSAVTGANPLWWMAVLSLVGFWVTLFLERGGLSDADLKLERLRSRRTLIVLAAAAGVVLLFLCLGHPGPNSRDSTGARPARRPHSQPRAEPATWGWPT